MDGLVIGLDLNDDYTRISCYDEEKSWTIPTVICRKKQEEVWLAGEDAYACTLVGEGVIGDPLHGPGAVKPVCPENVRVPHEGIRGE